MMLYKLSQMYFVTLYFTMLQITKVLTLPSSAESMSLAYFQQRDLRQLCYLSCDPYFETKSIVNNIITRGIRTSVMFIDKQNPSLKQVFKPLNIPVGVLLDSSCKQAKDFLKQASAARLFDALHYWLIVNYPKENSTEENCQFEQYFSQLNLSINTDVVLGRLKDDYYELIDIFNYGKIQGNTLEQTLLGTWTERNDTEFVLNGFRYYNRWNFNNLTLRAVSVILERPKVFKPEMLTGLGYIAGVSAMTKIVAQLLNVLMEQHNFRFNYTIVGRWIGSPKRNSTMVYDFNKIAVTNSLYWGEQDISCTCARIFPEWLNWVDIFYPAATTLETKFYYLVLDKGIGGYENRFLTPMSSGVWWCSCIAGVACIIVLAVAAKIESRPEPHIYAFFSVLATTFQQEYEDGVQILQQTFSSQGRRLILLVVGLTSMLLYNYYTSSVVSWLLNAAVPTLGNLEALMNSDLELVFEDIGYTRGWLDNPGFFYYSGYKNSKEDQLRDKKVINGKRTVPLLQPVNTGIELIRNGAYAYHTEPYNAYQAISKTFDETELCNLGYLQMMQPAQVYIMAQKNSPYKQFFVWSLMRLQERGHITAAKGRVGDHSFVCSGRTPRALALGQAAPAFVLLVEATLLSIFVLIIEILWHRVKTRRNETKCYANKVNDFEST